MLERPDAFNRHLASFLSERASADWDGDAGVAPPARDRAQ
jgi:hypothetical protein